VRSEAGDDAHVEAQGAVVDTRKSHGDFVSRELFESILDPEKHIDFLETHSTSSSALALRTMSVADGSDEE